jgi:hypothetical protein
MNSTLSLIQIISDLMSVVLTPRGSVLLWSGGQIWISNCNDLSSYISSVSYSAPQQISISTESLRITSLKKRMDTIPPSLKFCDGQGLRPRQFQLFQGSYLNLSTIISGLLLAVRTKQTTTSEHLLGGHGLTARFEDVARDGGRKNIALGPIFPIRSSSGRSLPGCIWRRL